MRPKLLKSFIVITLFWFVATTLWWSLQDPSVNLRALQSLKALFPFVPIQVPADASIFASLGVQLKVLTYWTIPVLVGAVLSAAIGYGLMWLKAHKKKAERTERESSSGKYRGVSLTVGVLPTPKALPKDFIELGADNDSSLACLSPAENKLLADILGTISAHPDSHPGEGITVPLLEHTLNIVSKALERPRNPALSAIVAAAHELGNISAYKKTEQGEWIPERTKSHDKEAARILGYMDSWFALPNQDKNAIMMAVKFYSNVKALPEIESDPQTYRLARDLLTAADDTQRVAVVEEKQRTLDKNAGSLSDVIFGSFLQALPTLSFQSRGLPKGVAAVAWKVGTRVYLLEIKLRETVSAKIPGEVRGALTPNPKERARLQPFTLELLKALEARGWLVKKIGDSTVDSKEALWNIKAGKLEFKGVIVIDVPQEHLASLPAEDSMYEISVVGPLFAPAMSQQFSKQDLMGSVLRAPVEKPNTDNV